MSLCCLVENKKNFYYERILRIYVLQTQGVKNRIYLPIKRKAKFKKMFFKRLCLRQQNTVITERQEVNKMNLCGFSFLLGRRNKLEMANPLSWGNWPVNSQKRILESTELHKEFQIFAKGFIKYSNEYCSVHKCEEISLE